MLQPTKSGERPIFIGICQNEASFLVVKRIHPIFVTSKYEESYILPKKEFAE